MKTKTMIQIIMGLSLYFSFAASADPGTQGPTNYGPSLGQVSPLSIESKELSKRIAKCMGQVLKEHATAIMESSIPASSKIISVTYDKASYGYSVARVITPSCSWSMGFQESAGGNISELSIGALMLHNIPCSIKPKHVNPDQYRSYVLNTKISKKSPPHINCKNSDLTNVVINHDTGEYSGTTNLSNCSVADYEGETIEFYNSDLVQYLEKAGKAKEIKPQFVYSREQYSQCLQEAISH